MHSKKVDDQPDLCKVVCLFFFKAGLVLSVYFVEMDMVPEYGAVYTLASKGNVYV